MRGSRNTNKFRCAHRCPARRSCSPRPRCWPSVSYACLALYADGPAGAGVRAQSNDTVAASTTCEALYPDVVFLLDTSLTISQSDFANMKAFVLGVAQLMTLAPNASRCPRSARPDIERQSVRLPDKLLMLWQDCADIILVWRSRRVHLQQRQLVCAGGPERCRRPVPWSGCVVSRARCLMTSYSRDGYRGGPAEGPQRPAAQGRLRLQGRHQHRHCRADQRPVAGAPNACSPHTCDSCCTRRTMGPW